MKWTFRAVVSIPDADGALKALLDSAMEALVDLGVDYPSVSASSALDQVAIEFLVEADSMDEAELRGCDIYEVIASPGTWRTLGRSIEELVLV
jgi:hypothetical protein